MLDGARGGGGGGGGGESGSCANISLLEKLYPYVPAGLLCSCVSSVFCPICKYAPSVILS